jgi:tetratricopeptide (TPR) repeat protein
MMYRPSHFVSIPILCLAFWGAWPAQAATPVPFGLPVQYRNAQAYPVEAGIRDISTLAALDTAEADLADLERTLGPYHPDLAAMILDVAAAAAMAGDYELATTLYDKALHNARVNDGLYGDQQLPILRGLLDLFLLSGDRQGFEARAAYQFRLLGSGLPPFDEGEMQAAIELFSVSLDALMGVSWAGRAQDLLRMHDRFDDMAEAVCADDTVGPQWCEAFTFMLARFYYLLEYKLDVFVDDPRFERTFSDPDWQSLDREPRLEALQRRLFSRGEKAFERLLAVSPENHDALSALADWNWFYRKRDKAKTLYRQACSLEPSRFETASPLPEYPALAFELAFQESYVPINAYLVVTEKGRARDLEVELADIASESGSPPGRVRRAMRAMSFRPAFVDCNEPVESPVELELIYVD